MPFHSTTASSLLAALAGFLLASSGAPSAIAGDPADETANTTQETAANGNRETADAPAAEQSLDDIARRWVEQLGHDYYYRRLEASSRLSEMGIDARTALCEGLDDIDPEIRVRCRRLLSDLVDSFREPLRLSLAGHKSWVATLDVTAARRLLASGSGDKQIRLWDAASGEWLFTLGEHRGWIRQVEFSPDGKLLASTSTSENFICLWDTETGRLIRKLEGHTSIVQAICFTPDGQRLASGGGHGDHSIKFWNVATGGLERSWDDAHRGPVFALDFTPNGKLLVSGSGDGSLVSWDRETGEPRHTLDSSGTPVAVVRAANDGVTVASVAAYRSRSIKLWNLETGQRTALLLGHDDHVYAVDFSPNAEELVSVGLDKQMAIWDVPGGKLKALYKSQGRYSHAVRWSPDGKTIFTGDKDGQVRLWDTNTIRLRTLLGLDRPPDEDEAAPSKRS